MALITPSAAEISEAAALVRDRKVTVSPALAFFNTFFTGIVAIHATPPLCTFIAKPTSEL